MAGAVRIGTRGSPLARWQAEWGAGQLRRHHPDRGVALVEIRTRGERDRNSPLAAGGGIGVFTKELQRELLEGTIDLAVHSLKDLPTRGPAGLALAVVPPRGEPGDALAAPTSRTFGALPGGARVGTGSLRRRAIARPPARPGGRRRPGQRRDAARPGAPGPARRGGPGRGRAAPPVARRVRHPAARPPAFLPAVAQAAIGLECRADDVALRALLAPLDDAATHRAVRAERRVLAELEGGCMIPLAAWARDAGGELVLVLCHSLILG
jgi:hydroxymethylbilane synthase